MKVYNAKEIVKILTANGFVIVRTKKHSIWRNPTNGNQFPLPLNGKEVNRMMWQRIVRENNIKCDF